MIETATLALLGNTALTDGIGFLYGQAGDVLARWRDRRDSGRVAKSRQRSPDSLDGTLDTLSVNAEELQRLAALIGQDRGVLNPYLEGFFPVDARDKGMLEAMARLRASLEAVYGQAITFRGETGRPATGTHVSIRATLGDIYGDAHVAEIGNVENAGVEIGLMAGDVKEGGSLTYARIDRIGRADPDAPDQS